jgi:hypothetical protein
MDVVVLAHVLRDRHTAKVSDVDAKLLAAVVM